MRMANIQLVNAVWIRHPFCLKISSNVMLSFSILIAHDYSNKSLINSLFITIIERNWHLGHEFEKYFLNFSAGICHIYGICFDCRGEEGLFSITIISRVGFLESTIKTIVVEAYLQKLFLHYLNCQPNSIFLIIIIFNLECHNNNGIIS